METIHCKLYIIFSRKNNSLTTTLSFALEKIFTWLENWQLALSNEKCAVMHLGSKNPETKYHLGGYQLPITECYKDLGILIDNNLSFHSHYNAIVTKAFNSVNMILFVCLFVFISKICS